MSAFLGLLVFLAAAVWEAHVAAFLPSWAGLFPLWPLTVLTLCLETDRWLAAAWLAVALAWEELARPASLPPSAWAWVPLFAVSAWLLRVRLSHRSLWSALVLVAFGRAVWIAAHAAQAAFGASRALPWGQAFLGWLGLLGWDLAFTTVAFPLALRFAKRAPGERPSFFARRSRV